MPTYPYDNLLTILHTQDKTSIILKLWDIWHKYMQINQTYIAARLPIRVRIHPLEAVSSPPPTFIKRTPCSWVTGLLNPASILWGALYTFTLIFNIHPSFLCPVQFSVWDIKTWNPLLTILVSRLNYLHSSAFIPAMLLHLLYHSFFI